MFLVHNLQKFSNHKAVIQTHMHSRIPWYEEKKKKSKEQLYLQQIHLEKALTVLRAQNEPKMQNKRPI